MARVLVVQTDPVFGEVARNIEQAKGLCAGRRADLVVLPELFAAGYQFASHEEVGALSESVDDSPTVRALEEIARETGATVVGGFAERASDGKLYNSAAIVQPGGFLSTYRKVHLFFEERTWFARGDRLPPVVWTPSGLRVGVMICFDWRFPETMRWLALEGADIVAHPSNLVRPHCPDAMITRCLENVCFGATSNRVGEEARGGRPPLRYIGRSQVVSPRGERLAALPGEGTGVVEVDVDPAIARAKGVTGCEDLFAARRTDLFALEGKGEGEGAGAGAGAGGGVGGRGGVGRRATLSRHEAAEGTHWDLFLEQADGSLMALRLEEMMSVGVAARRGFDHRAVYLDFEGELSRGRGRVTPVARGEVRRGGGRLEVRLGDEAWTLTPSEDRAVWRVER